MRRHTVKVMPWVNPDAIAYGLMGSLPARSATCGTGYWLTLMNNCSRAGCIRRRTPKPGPSLVEVLFALMARADDEDQFRRTNVEPQDVTRGAKRDDQFAKCRA